MKKLGDGREGNVVSFICDEDEEHSHLAPEAYRNLKETNPSAAKYMATFSSADDKFCEPLQAADAAVYEVRRALNLALGQRQGFLRKQFNILSDSSALFLITHTSKEQLLHIIQTHKPGQPFNLDTLMEMHQDENIKLRV